MKICVYCPSDVAYPPNLGVIRANLTVAGDLANSLVDLGQDVLFFGPSGSKTKAKLVPLQKGSEVIAYMQKNKLTLLSTHCQPFDIVDYALKKPAVTTVITVHDPLSYAGYRGFERYNQYKNLHFVSLSDAQRKSCPQLLWEKTIYNGIDTNLWTFSQKTGKYLLFVGRIMKEKGPDLAVKIAQKVCLPLKIAGSIYDKDQDFFDQTIKPYLNQDIWYLGAVEREKLPAIYKQALAFIYPIRWEEPFGLVCIEAMSCGTPIVTSRHGAMPELITPKTGIIIDDEQDIDEFTNGIRKSAFIKRSCCHQRVLDNFSLEAMANNYLSLFSGLQP